MSNLENDMKELFGLSKIKVKPVVKSEKVIVISKPEKENPIDLLPVEKIDFSKLAETSDFKRLVYLAITGETFRGKNITLERILNNKIKKLRSN